MKYKEQIIHDINELTKIDQVLFIGQGVINAGKVYGTLSNVPINKCMEMPIAENLMVGTAIGIAMLGYIPVVIFHRFNFVLNAADAIINHLATFKELSNGQLKPKVIIRVIQDRDSGNFKSGPQHTGDFQDLFKSYIYTSIYHKDAYKDALALNTSSMIIEERWRYEEDAP